MVGNSESEAQMGRPPKKDSQKRRNRMVILLTDAERKRVSDFIEDHEFDGDGDFGRAAFEEFISSRNRSNKPDGD